MNTAYKTNQNIDQKKVKKKSQIKEEKTQLQENSSKVEARVYRYAEFVKKALEKDNNSSKVG